MGLIRFLAIVALGYLLFKLIGRFLLPYLTRKVVKKAAAQMEEQLKRQQEGEKIYQDGKVTIRKPKEQNSASNKNSSDRDEYVDYEEV
jgi:hypothetical protein